MRRWTHAARLALIATVLGSLPALPRAQIAPDAHPPGADKSRRTRALELGARALQTHAPVGTLNIYLNGFHPMKDDPGHQVEAHHFCHQVNEDFAQCVLFDSAERTANLTGIEYIISEKLFLRLPEAERRYWHPHNGEILSGQLIAPGIPRAAEKALMRDKVNSYGKTWHVWHTGAFGMPGDALPLGEPRLAWSFNRDGEIIPGLLLQRDQRLRLQSTERRRERADLQQIARPQEGVDALLGAFPRDIGPIPGVVDARAVAPSGQPVPAAASAPR
ncbi:MAG: OBAP family protein [Aquabacterium sp.]